MDDSEERKLFVGGISWDTTEDTLSKHFGKYGTVVGCLVGKDRNLGTPRGFGFVSFSETSALSQALGDTHEILGRMVEVKKAIPRSEIHQNQQQSRGLISNCNAISDSSNDQFNTKKIFVGGLSANLTQEEFKGYFEKFGRVTDVVLMYDNVTHRPRGFGFITFNSEDAVEDVMQKNFHDLSGKLVEVKRAIPKEVNNNSSNSYNAKMGNGRSNYNNYHRDTNPSYGPRYRMFPGYGPLSEYGGVAGYSNGAGVVGGGYLVGAYGGICYGVAPVMPGGHWNGPAMVGVWGSPLPCGSVVYPTSNVGVRKMAAVVAANGYSGVLNTGVNEKLSEPGGGEAQVAAHTKPTLNDRSV